MTEKPYQNNVSQADRAATLQNDRRVQKDTFHSRQIAGESQLPRDRFFNENKSQIMGAYLSQYPKLPADHWSNQTAAVPPEESLGFSVEEVPVVGEPHEIEASLERAQPSPSSLGADCCERAGTDPVASSADAILNEADSVPHERTVSVPTKSNLKPKGSRK